MPLQAKVALLLAALWAASPGSAVADPASIIVQIVEIEASNQGPRHMDPALEKLRGQLEAHRFESYKVVNRRSKRAASGEALTFWVQGGQQLQVTPNEDGGLVKLTILVLNAKGERLLKMCVRLKSGGTHLMGMPQSGAGERLFLAITTQM